MVREDSREEVQTPQNGATRENILQEKMASMQKTARKMVHLVWKKMETYCEA